MVLDKNYSSKSPTGVYFFNSNCIDSFSGHKKKKKKYKNKKERRAPACGRGFCYLEQQLVFGDSLNWFNKKVTNSQSGLDVLLDSLKDGRRIHKCTLV